MYYAILAMGGVCMRCVLHTYIYIYMIQCEYHSISAIRRRSGALLATQAMQQYKNHSEHTAYILNTEPHRSRRVLVLVQGTIITSSSTSPTSARINNAIFAMYM